MINLVRAQWFRLMRNRAFWGLLAVFAGVVLVASLQVTERGLYEEAYRNIPLLAQHSPAAMVSMTMDVEAVMGEFWTPQLLALIIALLSAGFFGDDFRCRGTRLLAAVLLSGGVASTALLSVSWALGCEEVLRPLIAAMPAAQLGQLSIEGVTPGAFDILPLLGWLAAAAGLCWAVLRRRAL